MDEWIQRYDFSEQKTEFGYSTKSSAVYSANIEGNTVDLNSYMNQKLSNQKVKPTKEMQWGPNAENAFSYHIVVNRKADGVPATEKVACDIAGENWSNYYIPDYAFHLPDFVMVRSSTTTIWEFSLAVYDDSYQAAAPAASRRMLQSGDVMGLSLAYCDNDDAAESPKKRDHFIGSVWVPAAASNDHWMNASGFGMMRLMGQSTGIDKSWDGAPVEWGVYPNPGRGLVRLQASQPITRVAVYNLAGQLVLQEQALPRQGTVGWLHPDYLPDGVYFIHWRQPIAW